MLGFKEMLYYIKKFFRLPQLISFLFLFFMFCGCSAKKYNQNDGERIFASSSNLQVDNRFLGNDIEEPMIIENSCMLTTDFDYQNAGLSMKSYPNINLDDYKKYFLRSGENDFYIHPIICDNNVINIKNNSDIEFFSLTDGKVKKLETKKILSFKEKKNIILSQARLENNILYIATSNGYIIAFDTNKKELIWKKHFNKNFTSSPTLYNDMLFIVSVNDDILVLNAKNGDIEWSYNDNETVNVSSFQTAPIAIFHGKVVAGLSNGNIVVLNSETGDLIWKNKISSARQSGDIININDIDFPPILFNNVLVVGGIKTSVMGFDFKTGQPLWQIPTGLNSYMLHNNQGFGFFVNSENENICFYIGNGAIRWINSENTPIINTPIAGYLNNGKNSKTTRINRYFDAY